MTNKDTLHTENIVGTDYDHVKYEKIKQQTAQCRWFKLINELIL
jgi:hypothetical protein